MKLLLTLTVIAIFSGAVAQKSYKISAYEVASHTYSTDQGKLYKRYRNQITNLLVKSDSLWKENETYHKKDSFYVALNGASGAKIYARYRTDSQYFFSRREIYYAPKPHLKLDNRLSRLMLYEGEPIFSRACFLTNNKSYKRTITLNKYTPTRSDFAVIKTNFFPYIIKRFSTYCEHSLGNWLPFADSVFKVLDTNHISIDKQNTFFDQHNNKLITFIIPYSFIYRSVYPFNSECFREDNGYDGLRISCYIDNQDRITFLRDELTYLEHGDFDNDGKEEFLFWYHIHNSNGYILCYDNFKKTAKFMWSYH